MTSSTYVPSGGRSTKIRRGPCRPDSFPSSLKSLSHETIRRWDPSCRGKGGPTGNTLPTFLSAGDFTFEECETLSQTRRGIKPSPQVQEVQGCPEQERDGKTPSVFDCSGSQESSTGTGWHGP